MPRSLHDALEETLGFIQRALDRIRAGDNAEAELHNVRAYLVNVLELVERDPGIEAASDDSTKWRRRWRRAPTKARDGPAAQRGVLALSRPASDRAAEQRAMQMGLELAMIPGEQIRAARKLLGWHRGMVAIKARAGVSGNTVGKAAGASPEAAEA